MLSGKNFITRDPSNHNQRHQRPGTVSIAQPLGTFDLSNMQPKPPSLPQTEVAQTCTEREAAVTKEFKSKTVFICLKILMLGARAIREIQKDKESRWCGIDLCVGEKDCWGKITTLLMGHLNDIFQSLICSTLLCPNEKHFVILM